MRAAVIAVTLVVSACAVRQSPAPAPRPAASYIFQELLSPETRICVPRTPWEAQAIECLTLEQLRAWLRHRRLAHFEFQP